MFNKRILTIIKRELQTKLLSRTFIIMTLLVPLFLFGIIGMQTFFVGIEGDAGTSLKVFTEDNSINTMLEKAFNESDAVKNDKYKIDVETVSAAELDKILEFFKNDLLNNKISGIIFIPNNALTDKSVQYYSKYPNNYTILYKIRNSINTVLIDKYFEGKSFSEEEISFARKNVDYKGFRVSKEEAIEEEGFGNQVLAYLFTFLLYFSLLFTGTTAMRAAVEEKTSRIVEVLLSSINAKELMTGKILGNTITALIQMFIWLIPVMLLISTTWFVLPKELSIGINSFHIIYFLLNYCFGLLTFLGLFIMVGSIFDNEQDAQSGLFPIMLLIMVPFFMAFSLRNNPDNTLGLISSMAPFSSIIVMPARMTLTDIPLWQFGIAVAVNISVVLLIFALAGKIYRVGILSTGKKPSWKEVIKWLKFNY
ncbi:MAG: ABC transporter permease [Bacteroidetes bacterium]|nr:ABC transporter permease [Bacteroidota bacterium]